MPLIFIRIQARLILLWVIFPSRDTFVGSKEVVYVITEEIDTRWKPENPQY